MRNTLVQDLTFRTMDVLRRRNVEPRPVFGYRYDPLMMMLHFPDEDTQMAERQFSASKFAILERIEVAIGDRSVQEVTEGLLPLLENVWDD